MELPYLLKHEQSSITRTEEATKSISQRPLQLFALIWRLLPMMSKNGLSARKAPKRVEMAVLTLRAFAQLSLAQRVLTIIMLLLSKETLATREN